MITSHLIVKIKQPPRALPQRIREQTMGKVFLAREVRYDLAPQPETQILVDAEILILVVMGPQALRRLREFVPAGGEVPLRPEEVEIIAREPATEPV